MASATLSAVHRQEINKQTAERELLSTVETLKECRNMLLRQQIKAFTDHKNPVCEHFNTERVVRWRLLSEEFGPKLTCLKGTNNVVADALSEPETTEEEFSAEAFADELANEEEEFPTGCSLSHEEMAFRKKKDRALQNKLRTQPGLHIKKPHIFSDSAHELIAKNDKIYVPKCLQHKCAEWHHLTLMHPGEQRLELITVQRRTQMGLKATCLFLFVCQSPNGVWQRGWLTLLLCPPPLSQTDINLDVRA